MATITTTTPPENLTGWTVTVPANWTATAGYGEYDLGFSVNDSGCQFLKIGYEFSDNEAGNSPASNSIFSWFTSGDQAGGLFFAYSSDPLTFSISGGVDTSDPSLIQWFVDNKATFTKEGEEEEKVTIPAGTYRFKDNVSQPLFNENVAIPIKTVMKISSSQISLINEGYKEDLEAAGLPPIAVQDYSISSTYGELTVYYNDDSTNDYYSLVQLNNFLSGAVTPYDATLISLSPLPEQGERGSEIYHSKNTPPVSEGYEIFEVVESTDVSSQFGTWFTENTEPYSEEPTTTSHGEIYYDGNLVDTLIEGEFIVLHAKDFKFLGDIVIKNVGEVEEETPTLISFTIAGTTYQAEEGMTWGDWVDSQYNTGNFAVQSTGWISNDNGYLHIGISRIPESSSTEIVANESYVLIHIGGGV